MKEQIQKIIDLKTKPLGSLGRLESIALQIASVQNTTNPSLSNPHILVFAADHGIAQSGVSAYPQEVTYQMVMNFLNGGAAINVFCKQNDIKLKIVDAGVNFDFDIVPGLQSAKAGKGTNNFLLEPAMSRSQYQFCLDAGSDKVKILRTDGCNVFGVGEMGIGNTSSASMIFANLFDLPISECVGRGTGLDDAQLQKKIAIIENALEKQGRTKDSTEIMQRYGGFEIAQMAGAFLEGYKQNMILLVDGFIATAAIAWALSIEADILNNCIFCHESDEQAHQTMLERLGVKPLTALSMRVGEGTGCAVAYPIIKSALHFYHEMASFEDAQVSNKA